VKSLRTRFVEVGRPYIVQFFILVGYFHPYLVNFLDEGGKLRSAKKISLCLYFIAFV